MKVHTLSVNKRAGWWVVECSQGCDLGLSAQAGTEHEASQRAALHTLAQDARGATVTTNGHLDEGEHDAIVETVSTYVQEELGNLDCSMVEYLDLLRAVQARINTFVDAAVIDIETERARMLCPHNEPNNGEWCRQCARDDAELDRAGL